MNGSCPRRVAHSLSECSARETDCPFPFTDVDFGLNLCCDSVDDEGESSHRSQHLNGNRLSVSTTEHSNNQCTIGLTRGPFIYSAFRAVNPSSIFLTPAWPNSEPCLWDTELHYELQVELALTIKRLVEQVCTKPRFSRFSIWHLAELTAL